MKSSVVAVDKNLKEQISHGNYAFPVDVHSEVFQAEGTGAPPILSATGIPNRN